MKMTKTWLALVIVVAVAGTARAKAPEGDLLDGVAPGPDGMIDVVSVTAHPDDESIYAGGALIKMKKDPRVRLHVVCMTLGDASDARLFMAVSAQEMARIRTEELEAAGRALGADEVIQLSHHDQGLKPADQEALVEEARGILDRTGAELVITHDPAGVTRHPDHITCSRVVTEACRRLSSVRLYYATMPPARYLMGSLGSPFHEGGTPARPTVTVDISAELPQKRKAVFAHESQMRHSLVGLNLAEFYWNKHEWFARADLD